VTLTKNPGNQRASFRSSADEEPETRPTTGVSAVAFDVLLYESRPRARDAALSYLGESVKKNELVGVFLTDLSVLTLQPFTYDTQQVKAAIERAGTYAPSLYKSNNSEARAAREAVTAGLLKSQGGGARPEPNTESLEPLARMMLSNLEYLEEMDRDQQGNATTHGLLHIASTLRAVPDARRLSCSRRTHSPRQRAEVFRSESMKLIVTMSASMQLMLLDYEPRVRLVKLVERSILAQICEWPRREAHRKFKAP
jgi:hypothetical protein